MRRIFPILTLLVFAALFAKAEVKAAPREAPARTAAEIISLINAYRAENGLPAYQQNSILMGTAQDQSEYQAAIGSVTHEGPGGSRPRDRAYAAGYGSGKIIWISEIIYGYTFAGPDAAVNWWKTSEIHNYTMLAPQYKDIGAGVAVANNRYYYTAVVGWISIYDNPDSTPTSGPSPTASVPPVASAPTVGNPTSTATKSPSQTPIPGNTAIPASAIATFTSGPSPTPLPEGALIHIVQSGETLSIIAARYGLALEEILALNGLTLTSLIFPGDEILIQAAPTATDTSTSTNTAIPPSETPGPPASATSTETISPTSAPESEALPPIAASDNGIADSLQSSGADPNIDARTLIAIALFSIALFPVSILIYVFSTPRGN